MNVIEIFDKLIQPVKRKISAMVLRGVVHGMKEGKLQFVQMSGLADETLDNLEYIEPYGFTSKPGPGAEAVALFIGGNRDHGIVLSVGDRRYRLAGLAADDVALYHKDGTKIVLKGGGKIQIFNPAGNELFATLSTFLGDLIASNTMDPLSGPQPFMPADITKFQASKTKIDSFKV